MSNRRAALLAVLGVSLAGCAGHVGPYESGYWGDTGPAGAPSAGDGPAQQSGGSGDGSSASGGSDTGATAGSGGSSAAGTGGTGGTGTGSGGSAVIDPDDGLPAGPVFHVSPSASGSGDGSEANLWTSAQALQRARPGDTVLFKDGVYRDALFFSRSGEPGAPIVFRAAPGALPVIEGPQGNNHPGIASTAVVHDLVIQGFLVRNWRWAGIDFSWGHRGCKNITIRYCIADSNQVTGIAAMFSENMTVERNIGCRNGWGPDSWSSNINIYGVRGTNNIVRGNVAFHGVDTSSHQTDGNGFILDLTIDQGSALFENNLSFLNGGAGFVATDSAGIRLIGNTSFHNSQAIDAAEYGFTDTCRDVVTEIPVNGQRYSMNNVVYRNNVGVAASGKKVEGRWSCGQSTAFVNGDERNNHLVNGDGRALFSSVDAADFRPKSGTPLESTANALGTASEDIGFDAKCLKRQTGQRYSWWTHAPDEAYIRSIGGIARCFAPRKRPHGSGQEIGAYELP